MLGIRAKCFSHATLAICPNLSYSEFIYSYGLYFNPTFTDIVQEWLEADERYPYITGEARSPETWQDQRKDNILTKLYHRGRYEGMNDKYTSYNLRFAELYLMKAELLARTSPTDIDGALAELNRMRQSYTNPVLAPVTGIATHQELMDAIFREYVVTLLMENETPWFASLRFEHDDVRGYAHSSPKSISPKTSIAGPYPTLRL